MDAIWRPCLWWYCYSRWWKSVWSTATPQKPTNTCRELHPTLKSKACSCWGRQSAVTQTVKYSMTGNVSAPVTAVVCLRCANRHDCAVCSGARRRQPSLPSSRKTTTLWVWCFRSLSTLTETSLTQYRRWEQSWPANNTTCLLRPRRASALNLAVRTLINVHVTDWFQ